MQDHSTQGFSGAILNMLEKRSELKTVVNKEALNPLVQAHDANIEGRNDFMKYDPL